MGSPHDAEKEVNYQYSAHAMITNEPPWSKIGAGPMWHASKKTPKPDEGAAPLSIEYPLELSKGSPYAMGVKGLDSFPWLRLSE